MDAESVAEGQVNALSDEEIRSFTLWETDTEIVAFKIGWCYRRKHGKRAGAPEAKSVAGTALTYAPSSDWGQNDRVAWERGWMAADAVHLLLAGD
jgi:hypothetical protein